MATRLPDARIKRVRFAWVRSITSRDLELWIPATLLTVLVLACFLGPALFHLAGPNAGNLNVANEGIGSPGHLLGTNALGNDLLSSCLFGGRVSIEVGLGAVFLGAFIGGSFGVIAGYFGRGFDSIITRVFDTLLAFPSIILALAIAAYFGPSERDEIIAIAFFTIPAFGRLARGATLRLSHREFVLAARISGASRFRIILDHIVPNVLAPVFTFAVLTTAVAMIVEAVLSFLGLGIRPPAPSWGNLIEAGQQYLSSEPYMLLVPSFFLFGAVLLLNLLGDALRAKWEVD